MLVEIIATVHQLTKACRKYKGIVFTNKDGNIINDDHDPEHENIEITGVDDEEINDEEINDANTYDANTY